MRLRIDPEDLLAVEEGWHACPVEAALQRQTGTRWVLTAGGLRRNLDGKTVPVPWDLAAWVRAWETGKPVQPGEFEVPGI